MLAGCLSLPSHHSSSCISLLFILKWNHPLYDLDDPMISARPPSPNAASLQPARSRFVGCVLTGSGTYEMLTSLLDAAGIPCNMAHERKPCCSSSHSSLTPLASGGGLALVSGILLLWFTPPSHDTPASHLPYDRIHAATGSLPFLIPTLPQTRAVG